MKKTRIYHNPRCSKSRKALEILNDNKVDTEIILYLTHSLTKEMLLEILDLSNLSIREIIRTNEREYKDNNIDNEKLTRDQLLDLVLKFPQLLQRPIVIHQKKATLARPPENILKIL
tara:strand:+ start:2212 stop:2562 length:351 start_codon:yes stop_codon:yes gene_type:complete